MQKTDLHSLAADQDILVWFGHSSYFIQLDGKRMLIDPILGDHAAPLSFAVPSFAFEHTYGTADIPPLDFVFITHDHWDHLDYDSIMELKDKVKQFICPLGVGAHLEYWGIDPAVILETDWEESHQLDNNFTIHTMTSHHFSGRDLRRDCTLWAAYVLETPTMRLYLGGDGGYGPHFAQIGRRFGFFDLAILENGQYDPHWRYNHMLPEECLQAAIDLRAKNLLPVHSGKFALSNHPWDEPLNRLVAAHKTDGPRILLPMIGEPVRLKDHTQLFSRWWQDID